MKNTTTIAASLALFAGFASAPALADISDTVAPAGRDIGIGVELGAPTSLNLKFMTSPTSGIVIGAGGAIWYNASLSLHADYEVHPLVADFNSGSFSAYIGLGAWTALDFAASGPHLGYYQPYYASPEPLAVGARVPLGLSLAFNALPIELFGELVPSAEFFPALGGFGEGGIGFRVYL
jgi:hypothetical protein